MGLPALVLLAVSAISLALVLGTHLAAHRVLSRRPPRKRGGLPPVSILKPLKGHDDALEENLASFARLDYPEFEILFGVDSIDDSALAVARKVQREHRGVAIRVIVCDRRRAKNPKVGVVEFLAERAAHDVVLISDSNVRVRAEYLRDTAAELRAPGVGLVSNLIAGTGERSTGSLLENLQLGSFVAGTVAAADLAGHACVVGKSMLFRKSDLARLGGLRSVRHVLAEDYLIGQKFQRAGFRVVLSPHVIYTVNERWDVQRFFERHRRWSQMRRRINLPAYLGEPFLNPTAWAVLLAACGVGSAEAAAIGWAALMLGGKAVSDVFLLARLRGTGIATEDVPLIFAKDLLVLGAWGAGLFRRCVSWRGNELRVLRASRLAWVRREAADEAAPARAA